MNASSMECALQTEAVSRPNVSSQWSDQYDL